jgi:hypothetical protein
MQKGDVTKALEEVHPESSGIQRDIRGLQDHAIRNAIAQAVRGHKHVAQLPEKENVEKSMEALFTFSKLAAQPSAMLNTGAGIADLTFLYITFSALSMNNPLLAVAGGIGVIASEGVSHAKNYADNRHYSGFRKREFKYLRQCKSDIVSVLESKLHNAEDKKTREGIKSIIKETENLFKMIEARSKENLDTWHGKLAGLGSSGLAAALDTFVPPFSWLANTFSDYLKSFVRVEAVQPPGYIPPLALADLAARTILLVAVSSLIAGIAHDAYTDHLKTITKRPANSSIAKRQEALNDLKLRVDSLFGELQQV